MAKIYLKFDKTFLKEFPLDTAVVTIGRLPDNQIQVDNPAVSGHHARICWETDHFVIEDNSSLNGTFINDKRVTRQVLNHGDNIVIGKHTLSFKTDGPEDVAPSSTVAPAAILPRMEGTMVLDTKKAREMMAHAVAQPAPAAAPVRTGTVVEEYQPKTHTGGVLSVISGKTSQSQYALISKLNVIGKSDMASIKLKGWFAPKVAATVNHRDNKYIIAPSDKSHKVTVNGEQIAGPKELDEGDIIEVAKVKMSFSYSD